MPEKSFNYVIVGGGLAGASAIEGIREVDKTRSILLISAERDLPYHRPPLTKQLWSGKKTVDQVFVHDRKFYLAQGVALALGAQVVGLDVSARVVRDSRGREYRFNKLLLSTGGTPRRLDIPGGQHRGISYFRTLSDYKRQRESAAEGKSALVIGGGFIGSEIAAALAINKLKVTMIFPDAFLVSRVFPEFLGRALQDQYRARGVEILDHDAPVSIKRTGGRFVTETRQGKTLQSDMIIAGIGITPNASLAGAAGLAVGNGIVVNENLQTSNPDIYAAGDNAFFPETILGPRRVEHWDNAQTQGKCAGRNMAGATERYTHIPYFFSDLFEFGYEAVGEIDSRHEVVPDWQEVNKQGVLYYLENGRLRGAMMCNVWDKVDAARELIRKQTLLMPQDLRGTIR